MAPLNVRGEEREALTRFSSTQALATFASIILASVEPRENVNIARQREVEAHYVVRWRQRFLESRFRRLG